MVEGTVVATRGSVGGSQGHAGGGLMGGTDKEEMVVQPSWRNREQRVKLLRDMVVVQVDGGPQGSDGLECEL